MEVSNFPFRPLLPTKLIPKFKFHPLINYWSVYLISLDDFLNVDDNLDEEILESVKATTGIQVKLVESKLVDVHFGRVYLVQGILVDLTSWSTDFFFSIFGRGKRLRENENDATIHII